MSDDVDDRTVSGPNGEVPVRVYTPAEAGPFPSPGLVPRRRLTAKGGIRRERLPLYQA